MLQDIDSSRPRQPWYRREPWLAVLVAALAVMAAAPMLPDLAMRASIAVALVLTLVGLVLLFIAERRGPPA